MTPIPTGISIRLMSCALILGTLGLCTDIQAQTRGGVRNAAEDHPTRIHGRFAARNLYSTADDAVSKDVSFTFLDTDFEGENLTSWGTGLVLDARFLLDHTEANERRFGVTETASRPRQLYVEEPRLVPELVVSLGRRLISASGNAWVDGLVLMHRLNTETKIGVYGGLRPDVYDYSMTADYQTFGTYSTYRTRGHSADLGVNFIFNEGLDRQYVYTRTHNRLHEQLYLSIYSILDTLDGPELTTFLSTIDYTPVERLNLILNYTRYSLEEYRNRKIYRNVTRLNQALLLGDEVVDLVYNRVRFTASYRFWRRLYYYFSTEYKRRSQDRKESWGQTTGIRNEDLLNTGTRVDLRFIFRNHFQSDSWLVAFDADRDLTNTVSLNLYGTIFDGRTIDRFTERGRTFDEAQRVYLVGSYLFWRPVKAHHLSVAYDGVYETELQDQRNEDGIFIQTVMGRYGYYY